jgi:hypothetical protein
MILLRIGCNQQSSSSPSRASAAELQWLMEAAKCGDEIRSAQDVEEACRFAL